MIPFGTDTETHLFSYEEPVPRIVCGSYSVGDSSGVVLREEYVSLMREAISDKDLVIVGHNLPYDFKGLIREAPDLEVLVWEAYEDGRVYDTMVAAWLDDIARGVYKGSRVPGYYALAGLARRYLGEDMAKGEDTWRTRYGELDGVPLNQWPEDAISYAKRDAITPVKIRDVIRVTDEGIPDLERQCAHHWWLSLVGGHGVRTDPERVGALFDHITNEASKLVKFLLPYGFISFDKKGDMHKHPGTVQKYMTSHGYEIKETPKGGISVDSEACGKTGDPVLVAFSKLSKYLDAIAKDSQYLCKEFVRCSYGLAESGRSTCWGPNMQNLKTENYT